MFALGICILNTKSSGNHSVSVETFRAGWQATTGCTYTDGLATIRFNGIFQTFHHGFTILLDTVGFFQTRE